jgi:dTDP-4-amino-4,6-dideoxygalactose transaminase
LFANSGEQKVSDAMSDRLLSLPIYAEMTQEQIDYIVKLIKKFSYRN